MANNIQGNEKCEGIGCAYAPSCGRFIRPELPDQKWAAYYALPDDDCQYFESAVKGSGDANA
jgi:hypothetical protein